MKNANQKILPLFYPSPKIFQLSSFMNLTKVTGFISEKYKAPSICESCGVRFTCGVNLKGCWCAEITLSDETRQKLKGNYRGCLCRKCLENYASAEVEK